MSATTTLIGNTTSDLELRYTSNGKAVASVTIAVSDRVKKDNEWVDGKTWFARCTIWGEVAEQAAGSLPKGTRVIAFGRIEQRDWEDKDGNKRTSVEVTIDEIGPSTRYATAQVTKVARTGSPDMSQQAEPWAASAQTGSTVQGDVWNAPDEDTTPF